MRPVVPTARLSGSLSTQTWHFVKDEGGPESLPIEKFGSEATQFDQPGDPDPILTEVRRLQKERKMELASMAALTEDQTGDNDTVLTVTGSQNTAFVTDVDTSPYGATDVDISLYGCDCLDEVERSLIRKVLSVQHMDTAQINILAQAPKPPSPRVDSTSPSPSQNTGQSRHMRFVAKSKDSTSTEKTQTTKIKPIPPKYPRKETGPLSARVTKKEVSDYSTRQDESSDSGYETFSDDGDEYYDQNQSYISSMDNQRLPKIKQGSRFIPGLHKKPSTFRIPKSHNTSLSSPEDSKLPPIKMKIALRKPPPSTSCVFPYKGTIQHKSAYVPPDPLEIQKEKDVQDVLTVAREFQDGLDENWIWEITDEGKERSAREAGFIMVSIHEADGVSSDIQNGLITLHKEIAVKNHFSRRGTYHNLLEQKKKQEIKSKAHKNPAENIPRASESRIADDSRKLRYGSRWYINPGEWESLSKYGTPRPKERFSTRKQLLETLSETYSTKAYQEFLTRNKFRTPRFLDGVDLNRVQAIAAPGVIDPARDTGTANRPGTNGFSVTAGSAIGLLETQNYSVQSSTQGRQ